MQRLFSKACWLEIMPFYGTHRRCEEVAARHIWDISERPEIRWDQAVGERSTTKNVRTVRSAKELRPSSRSRPEERALEKTQASTAWKTPPAYPTLPQLRLLLISYDRPCGFWGAGHSKGRVRSVPTECTQYTRNGTHRKGWLDTHIGEHFWIKNPLIY